MNIKPVPTWDATEPEDIVLEELDIPVIMGDVGCEIELTHHALERWLQRKFSTDTQELEDMARNLCNPVGEVCLTYYMEYLRETTFRPNNYAVYKEGFIIVYEYRGDLLKIITVYPFQPWYAEQEMYQYYGYDVVPPINKKKEKRK